MKWWRSIMANLWPRRAQERVAPKLEADLAQQSNRRHALVDQMNADALRVLAIEHDLDGLKVDLVNRRRQIRQRDYDTPDIHGSVDRADGGDAGNRAR
jgi:predicted phage tail protein